MSNSNDAPIDVEFEQDDSPIEIEVEQEFEVDFDDAPIELEAEQDEAATSELEVEQKFAIYPGIENRLESLGFVRKSSKTPSLQFTDIYYDLPAPNWSLSTQDIWLRYRGRKMNDTNRWKGNWQLKIGRRQKAAQDDNEANVDSESKSNSVTVYEEVQGEPALTMAVYLSGDDESIQSLVEPTSASSGSTTDRPPEAPGNLTPFAEFETTRASWTLSQEAEDRFPKFMGLSVDIDTTDFGYGVGEVEAILDARDRDDAQALSETKKCIGLLLSQLSEQQGDNEAPSLGKLETFLKERQPDHFDALVETGIFRHLSQK